MRLNRKEDTDGLLDEENDEEDFSDEPEDDGLGLGSSAEDDLFKDDLGFDDFGMGNTQTPIEKHSDLLKGLTNFAPYLKDTVNGWLGLTWDEEKSKYLRDVNVKPLMNIYCASWCISFLKTYTRNNNIITNISKDEYSYLVEDIIDTVWLNIGTRAEEFKIKSDGDILRICTELEHAAQLVLMGAADGKYNQFLGTVTQRTENVSGAPNINIGNYPVPRIKQGVFGRIKSAIVGNKGGNLYG